MGDGLVWALSTDWFTIVTTVPVFPFKFAKVAGPSAGATTAKKTNEEHTSPPDFLAVYGLCDTANHEEIQKTQRYATPQKGPAALRPAYLGKFGNLEIVKICTDLGGNYRTIY